jgi:3-oxoacyl-[acyl-carrier protein] reductase
MTPTVLVTGGSGGIGRAICCEFGNARWRVAVQYCGRRDAAERTCALVKDSGGEGLPIHADLRDAAAVRRMVDEVATHWGSLDALIAGAGRAASGLLLRFSSDDWADTIQTNLSGTFHCLQAAGRIMLRQRSGSVVIVGSYAGLQGHAGQAAYAASKAGLIGLMKTAAREWGASNVRVNMILPGWHPTALAGSAVPNADALEDHVLRRTPALPGVAQAVYTLALLPDASGQVWNLDSRIL